MAKKDFDINEYIKEQVENIDVREIVTNIVRERVGDDVIRQLRDVVKNNIDEIIKTEIEIALKNPVDTDDGWGKTQKYVSFEALFKQSFYERLNSQYEMKRMIEKAVQEKVKQLFDQRMKEVTDKIVADITKAIP